MPVVRVPFNPVQYAFRTAGLVRGKHPYALIVDDEKKDDREHLYQWTAMLGSGVWQAAVATPPAGQAVLAHVVPLPPHKGVVAPVPKPPLEVHAGDALCLVCALLPANVPAPGIRIETAHDGPNDGKGPQPYDRLAIDWRAAESHFKVLMIPFRAGEAMPSVATDEAGNATVTWGDQTDTLRFTAAADHRTRVAVVRNGQTAACVP
jgi:hypothetical protein